MLKIMVGYKYLPHARNVALLNQQSCLIMWSVYTCKFQWYDVTPVYIKIVGLRYNSLYRLYKRYVYNKIEIKVNINEG